MYQPYRGGDSSVPTTERQTEPPSVRNAVRLMYAGAVASLIGMILGLATGVSKSAIARADPNLTATQVNNAAKFALILVIVSGLIGIAIWLIIARACARGSNGARITGTVFFGLDTLTFLLGLVGHNAATVKIYPLLVWLIGLGAVFYLWRRESSQFFSTRP
jgi:hypothetical protein